MTPSSRGILTGVRKTRNHSYLSCSVSLIELLISKFTRVIPTTAVCTQMAGGGGEQGTDGGNARCGRPHPFPGLLGSAQICWREQLQEEDTVHTQVFQTHTFQHSSTNGHQRTALPKRFLPCFPGYGVITSKNTFFEGSR